MIFEVLYQKIAHIPPIKPRIETLSILIHYINFIFLNVLQFF